MSKKAKYKAQERDGDYGRIYTVEKKGVAISSSWTITAARKIARALNAMEAKPKAKPFAFDWKGIHTSWRFAAVDKSGHWRIYSERPKFANDCWWPKTQNSPQLFIDRPPCPGDWRESLQERPNK